MPLSDEDKQEIGNMLVQAMGAARGGQAPNTAMLPAGGLPGMMMQPAGTIGGAPPTPTGVSLRLSIPLQDGSEVPAYLHFGPEVLQNIQVYIQQLAMMYPIRTYPPRQSGWGNRGGGWNGGGRGQWRRY